MVDRTISTQDWELMKQIRRACPVIRPAAGVVFTSRHEETAKTFRVGPVVLDEMLDVVINR